MKNIHLNPGGVIGAILLMGAVIAITVLTADPGNMNRRVGRFAIAALFVGALGGNYLWGLLFRRDK